MKKIDYRITDIANCNAKKIEAEKMYAYKEMLKVEKEMQNEWEAVRFMTGMVLIFTLGIALINFTDFIMGVL